MYVEHLFTPEEFEYLKKIATDNNMSIKSYIKKQFKATLTNQLENKENEKQEVYKENYR